MKWSQHSYETAIREWIAQHGDDFDSLREFQAKFGHLMRKRHKRDLACRITGYDQE